MVDRNGNENCLEGWECPKCGHHDSFKVDAIRRLTVDLFDDGTDDSGGDTEWDDDSGCECGDCGHAGVVREFQIGYCEEPPTTPVVMACEECGSENVFRDAAAQWDVDTQQWSMVTVYDHAVCEDCEGECNLIEKEIGS